MSKDRLNNSGAGKALSQESFSTVQANPNQQLRSRQGEESVYQSEKYKQTYHNQSQSYNVQRSQYTEQAFNDPVLPADNYDYQNTSISNAQNMSEAYKRYVSRDGGDSIFSSSDFDLASATENYLPKDSSFFSGKMSAIDKEIEKTAGKIGRIETNSLQYRNSYKFWKHRLVIDKNREKSKSWHDSGLIHRDVIHKEKTHRIAGRLKFRSEKIALTERKHRHEVHSAEGKSTRRGFYLRRLHDSIRDNLQGDNFSEDEITAEMKRKAKAAARGARWNAKRNYRKLKHTLDGYSRLKFQKVRLSSLNEQKAQAAYRSGLDLQRRKAEEAARQGLLREKQKRKIKKEMIQNYKREQGNFFVRTRNQHKMKKTVKKEKSMARKRTKTLVKSSISLAIFFFFIIILFFLFVAILVNTGGEAVANGVSQNDYQEMTDVTQYFRDKEAELMEYIKPENLEPIIKEEEPDIYEFIYEMDEISYDANTLVAYLSAKYNQFNLEMVKADLDEIFELYYTLEWEIKEEDRLLPDTTQAPDPVTGEYPLINKLVKICYIRLKKTNFYELLQSRIDDAAKQNQMDGFFLSGNGQQVYGPVMNVDWRNKISSNFGHRVHPITGEKKLHDGVDIAVPTGTALYSAVKGTVITSRYSDSAGNMITIQTDSGWQITFMHMDSRAVSVGDQVEQGQYVGASGNTGNSTGPHLHLQVHDSSGKEINPVFIIPFSTIEASETF